MMQPRKTDLQTWASSLVVDFPGDNIPMLSGDDWKSFGRKLVEEESFSNAGAPGPDRYSDWKSWASDVFNAVLNNE